MRQRTLRNHLANPFHAGLPSMPNHQPMIGKPVERFEDLRLLRGRGLFSDDVRADGRRTKGGQMGLNELSGVLWRERQLLELLLFKLEEEQLILSSGRTQWLGHATREVESVLDQIRTAELGRAMEADDAARQRALAKWKSRSEKR